MPLSSALIRAHLNPDVDGDGHLLAHYANVAAACVQAYTAQPFDTANPLLVQALLLLRRTNESRLTSAAFTWQIFKTLLYETPVLAAPSPSLSA